MPSKSGSDICSGCKNTVTSTTLLAQNEENVSHFLRHHKVYKDSINCTSCGRPASKNADGVWRCQRRKTGGQGRCNFKMTEKSSSGILRGAKLPASKILVFVNMWLTFRPPRQKLMMAELSINEHTYNRWSEWCGDVCFKWCEDNKSALGGPGKTVEIDESKFGKRKYNVGRLVEGVWVFGAFERGTKKVFLEAVPKRDKETLLTLIKKNILPGTTVISDCWKAYDCLASEGYQHLTVNHSINFVDPETGAYTSSIERVWRDSKETVPRYGRRKHKFAKYLAEFLFKRAHPQASTRLHAFLSYSNF